jgi:uncharacterized alkaline shock family protein YloU
MGGVIVTSSPETSTSTSQAGTQQRQQQASGGTLTARPETQPARSAVALETDVGNTRISGAVVAKIAGLAAKDIPGVYSMGTGMSRRVGQLRSLIPGSSEAVDQGVSVEVGEREAAIDLDLVTWYGQSIVDVTDAVRRNVIGQVQGMTGLRVVEVNIEVNDIHVEQPETAQAPARVQ